MAWPYWQGKWGNLYFESTSVPQGLQGDFEPLLQAVSAFEGVLCSGSSGSYRVQQQMLEDAKVI